MSNLIYELLFIGIFFISGIAGLAKGCMSMRDYFILSLILCILGGIMVVCAVIMFINYV